MVLDEAGVELNSKDELHAAAVLLLVEALDLQTAAGDR